MIVQVVLLLTRLCHIPPALTAAPPPRFTQAADDVQSGPAQRLAAVAHVRIANTWLRLGASGVVALAATSIVANPGPLWWFAGLVGVVLIDRLLHQNLLARCMAGRSPPLLGHIAWIAAQSTYSGALGALLWASPYLSGETLAVTYFCGLLANTAVTLRPSPALSLASAAPTVLFLLGLPLFDYLSSGNGDARDLVPLAGALVLLGFGVELWRSLVSADAARAKAEAAVLRERQAAAAAAAAKFHMIRRVNDELRAPIAALIGAAEHLRRAAASARARPHIATLVEAGQVLELVLDDLSDLDRTESRRLPLARRPTDPRELLRSVVAAFSAAAQDKDIELFLDIDAGTPAQVLIDPLRVRQVMFNLLANAVRNTGHGGVRVRLRARASPYEGCVRLGFVVADTGAGMSRSQLALIFGGGCTPAEGSGLGLSISLRLARLMGGQLQARSEFGEGSMFSLVLDAPVISAAPQLLTDARTLAQRRA